MGELRARDVGPSGLTNGKVGGDPVFEGAGVGDGFAVVGEFLRDLTGPIAGATIEDDFLAGVVLEKEFPELFLAVEIAHREQHGGRGDSAFGPFGRLADVDEHGFAGGDALHGFGGSNFRNVGGHGCGEGKEECGEEGEARFHGAKGDEVRRRCKRGGVRRSLAQPRRDTNENKV